jgi:hypothetical protein
MMFRWVSSLSLEERRKWFKFVADDLSNKGGVFRSQIIKEVPLTEWKEAIAESEKDASQGKYLIKCI